MEQKSKSKTVPCQCNSCQGMKKLSEKTVRAHMQKQATKDVSTVYNFTCVSENVVVVCLFVFFFVNSTTDNNHILNQ